MVLLSVAACEGSSSGSPKASGQGRAWSQAGLEKAVITGKDVTGYTVYPTPGTPREAGSRETEPAACAPIDTTLGRPGGTYAPTARVLAMISPKAHGPGANMTVASYRAGDAPEVVDEIRTAAGRCAAFKDLLVDFDYENVETRPGPGYGDNFVSLRLTQVLPGKGTDGKVTKVSYAVVAASVGTAVALFYSFNAMDKGQATVPDALVKAQLAKLAEQGASSA
ncbi:hypothetical protein OG607_16145 [Streptomyces sp. NBC_01537]|uniref:hypothetical protein n=1 Tax=Streptomyces sp. NBC_01537 TaxID=2903896 RepID=UPI00386C7ED5